MATFSYDLTIDCKQSMRKLEDTESEIKSLKKLIKM